MIVTVIRKSSPVNYMLELFCLLLYVKSVYLSLDDGGGMDPVAMRRCMSFGFSDKKSKSAIGQCMNSSNHSTVSFDYLLLY